MKVAILGGGPSGAFAAEQLASAGVQTVVLDEKLAWEKPCGGGLTYKAYAQYPFLLDNDTPKKLITETVLAAAKNRVTLALDHPLVIYSRFDLNALLLDRAQRAGAQLEKTRVTGIERADGTWVLRTKAGVLEADYCVVATGARNTLRDLGTELGAGDTMTAMGYFIPGQRERIDIQFFKGFEGYIWVFPRCGHLSVGICGKGEPASSLRSRLEKYIDEQGLTREGASFYGHVLPNLETAAWKHNRVAGEGWLAVGDAAGLVDPITGEGLYYAIRSADLAAKAILSETIDLAGNAYRKLLRRDFMSDLEFGSRLAKRVFHGSFLWGSVTSRMIQFTKLSPRFRSIMQDLFAGTQPYIGLKHRVMENLNGSLLEIICNLGLRKLIPGRDAA
ncbi:MAG: NAD(P)/FAD-dependent oxidoreductase [Acidobacteriaceae bacterium]|nr:NAD(P)/FAD-dependent oxidoreductase [Acidobacteriaceae bacterium]